MTSVLQHPAIILILAGLILPFVRGSVRGSVMLAAPLIALGLVWSLPDGVSLAMPFFGMDLEPIKTDKLSRLFGTVFTIMGFAGGLYALSQSRVQELAAAYVYMGFSLGVVFAGDLITVFVFWELMALASVMVIFAGGTDSARRAGMRYLLIHLLGGVILMAGIAGEVAQTGSVAFRSMLPDTFPRALILFGFLLNTGAPPFSSWVPDSYPEASYTGMVFLSAFTTKTAVYVLARGFPGAEILIFVGLFMIFYGILYGLCENNARKMLGYSIVNQVGFMVTGIGIGTELAVNGAVAHAFAHIIYKALLIMSVGSVFLMTGKRKFTEYGGLARTMPLTTICCIIGGLSISAFPLTSGFVAKAMMSDAAVHEGLVWVWYLLAAGTAGVFLDVGIKLQYFIFFGKDSGLRPPEPPLHMRLSMIFFAVLCIGIGVFPSLFYQLLPFTQDYQPYTGAHVIGQAQLLLFSGLAFFLWLRFYGWHLVETLTLDLDWLYRNWGTRIAKELIVNAALARDSVITDLSNGGRATLNAVRHFHGPSGVLAGNHPTGRMVFWAVAMLAAYLLLDYIIGVQ
jgi:multicomponent Na+:H+ antiporter subunit D